MNQAISNKMEKSLYMFFREKVLNNSNLMRGRERAGERRKVSEGGTDRQTDRENTYVIGFELSF